MTSRRVRLVRLSGFGTIWLTVCGGVLFALTLVFTGMAGTTSRVQAQGGGTAVGYQGCAGSECHTKSGEIDWLTSKPGGQEHRASFGRLRRSPDVSAKYAKAVGLASFDDPAGMCVRCHASYVVKAKTLEGVGCEGCHGPASGYREFHQQTPTNYEGAVQRGMRNLKRKPATWIAVCRDCHVLDKKSEYDSLIEAGHKDGARWNVSRKFEAVQTHWKKSNYSVALIADAAAGKQVNVPPPPPPGPDPSPGPAPGPGPGPVPAPGPGGPGPTPKPSGTSSGVDVPPPGLPKGPITPPIKTTAVVGTPPPVAPPPVAQPPAALPSSVVASPLSLAPPPPVSAAGFLAALQDGVEGLLETLLRRNAVPAAPLNPLGPAPQMTGPDADLLRLQYEALGLALEALNLRAKPGKPIPQK